VIDGVSYLTGWPFDVVAPRSDLIVWADREVLRKNVDRLVRRWGRHQASSLTVMWANFGAGKTHTLRYISSIVPDDYLVCSAVLPQSVRTFVEVYRAILAGTDLQKVARAAARTIGAKMKEGRFGLTDSEACLWALATGGESEQAVLAERWLRGVRLSRSEMNRIGVRANIVGNDEAVASLTSLVEHATASEHRRVVVLIDEFQRVGELTQRALNQVNQGIHTFFNSNPQNVSIVLSMSFGRADNVKYHLTPEVRSRVDPEQIHLDHLSMDEVPTFVADLLAAYRNHLAPPNPLAPFSAEAVQIVAETISPLGITPRRVMQALGRVLEDALDSGLEDGATISADDAAASVAALDFTSDQQE